MRVMERCSVESLSEDDFKELRVCEVVMQHNSSGKFAANGAVENTVQRLWRQVRAFKLDSEPTIT